MRLVTLLLALLACGAEDDMAARRPVTHQGPVHTGEGFRTAGQVGGQSFAAYQPPDQLTRPVPTTVPLGHGTTLALLGASVVSDRAYISRIKNLDDDIDVASVVANMGTPSAGTATAGVALYEVVPADARSGGRHQAYALRLLPGCSWFASVGIGSAVPSFTPTIPTKLLRSRSYAAAVVWNTSAVASAGSVVLNTAEAMGIWAKTPATLAAGFPPVVEVNAAGDSGVFVDNVSFRVSIEPARPTTLYTDFY